MAFTGSRGGRLFLDAMSNDTSSVVIIPRKCEKYTLEADPSRPSSSPMPFASGPGNDLRQYFQCGVGCGIAISPKHRSTVPDFAVNKTLRQLQRPMLIPGPLVLRDAHVDILVPHPQCRPVEPSSRRHIAYRDIPGTELMNGLGRDLHIAHDREMGHLHQPHGAKCLPSLLYNDLLSFFGNHGPLLYNIGR